MVAWNCPTPFGGSRVNQISTYLACWGDRRCSRTVPPTSLATAATRRLDRAPSESPTRSCRLAPWKLARSIRTLVTVAVRPRSRIRPVPRLRLPNWAVAYHWLCHGPGAPLVIAFDATRELSPSARPAGPNPAALATGSGVTAGGVGAGAVAVGVGAALAGAAGVEVSGACAAGLEGCVTAAAFLPVAAG